MTCDHRQRGFEGGARTLFDNVSVKFVPGNRYGLTGPNGAGKSTFMKILTGDIEPSNNGTIKKPKKVGAQRQNAFDNERIIETVMMGNAALWAALEKRVCVRPYIDGSNWRLRPQI